MVTDTDINDIRIKELRYSLVWVSLFKEGGTLRKCEDYCHEFTKAANNMGDWSVPWTEKLRVVFWEKYLEKNNRGTTTYTLGDREVISHVVPLRAKNLGKIDLMNKDQKLQQELTVWTEGFAYPHGVACIITLRWRSKDGLPLDSMVDLLINLKNEAYQWSNKQVMLGNKKGESLDIISQKILNHLSSKSGGKTHDRTYSPYTVVTIVEAENALSEAKDALLVGKPEADGMFHRCLDAFCTLEKDWRATKISDLKDALLVTKKERKDDVLYATPDRRAIWLPSCFRQHYIRQDPPPSKDPSIRYVGCYHRNITLATMQAAYLSLFLKWVNELPRKLTGDEQNWAKAAAGAVARLYGKSPKDPKNLKQMPSSYMSSSLPEQIFPLRDAINAVRANLIPDGKPLQDSKTWRLYE